MQARVVLCCIVLLSLATVPALASDRIVLWKRNYESPALHAVIELAARLSEPEFGPYELVSSGDIVQGRAFASLSDGSLLNVVVGGISTNRESQGMPIYIPLDRGILGFRVCLQRADAKPLTNITNLEDFKQQQIVIGVGSHWPDRQILETNGLLVAHTPVYEQLFDMLDRQRFDCFLRSMHEVREELKTHKAYNFKVEPNVGIIYAQADFAFVSAKTPRIHQRLQYGLKKALENGEFREHFRRFYAETLSYHKLYERKIIILHNPDLSIQAGDAINKYGLASFVNAPRNPLIAPSSNTH